MIYLKCVIREILKLIIVAVAASGKSMADDRMRLKEEINEKTWAMVARRDLAFMRQAIDSAHPAVLDKSDADFHAWLDDGYAQAQLLATAAFNKQQAMAALRFYAVGFMDGHLVVGPNPARPGKSEVA